MTIEAMMWHLSHVSQRGGAWNCAQAYQGYRAMSAKDHAMNNTGTAQCLHSCAQEAH